MKLWENAIHRPLIIQNKSNYRQRERLDEIKERPRSETEGNIRHRRKRLILTLG